MELIIEIAEYLASERAKISTAESCTAGYISKLLTSIPGSSNYFEGSLVVYSNKSKVNILGVDEGLIDTYTEVSEQVACAMAERVKEVMGTEYSIATTGYADSDGYGTEENPAGTIYVSIKPLLLSQVILLTRLQKLMDGVCLLIHQKILVLHLFQNYQYHYP